MPPASTQLLMSTVPKWKCSVELMSKCATQENKCIKCILTHTHTGIPVSKAPTLLPASMQLLISTVPKWKCSVELMSKWAK